MPRATVNRNSERFDLKTLEGAFVELKRMSYGEILDRRQMMVMTMESDDKKKGMKGELAMANRRVQEFEFRNTIVDHNLEDDNDVKLDLASVKAISELDPQVAQEIESLIEDMNNYDDDAVKN